MSGVGDGGCGFEALEGSTGAPLKGCDIIIALASVLGVGVCVFGGRGRCTN